MSDEITEAKDIVQRCVALATAWTGRPGTEDDRAADEDTEALLKALSDEMPEENLRQAYFTACMMLGMVTDIASQYMVDEHDQQVTAQQILSAISMAAERFFA